MNIREKFLEVRDKVDNLSVRRPVFYTAHNEIRHSVHRGITPVRVFIALKNHLESKI